MSEKITYVSARNVSENKTLIEIWKGGEKIIFSPQSGVSPAVEALLESASKSS